MSELKPCPFCGGEAEITKASEYQSYALCRACGASSDYDIHENKEDIVRAWNRRAPVTPIPVSEPPGDDDIVLLCRTPSILAGVSDPDLWMFDTTPERWSAAKDFGFRFDYGSDFRATHYLLLKSGGEAHD